MYLKSNEDTHTHRLSQFFSTFVCFRSKLSPDAGPQRIVNTLRLPSGVGATCVLKTPFNSTLDQLAQTLNPYANNSKTLAARYFDSMCLDSFTQGVPLSNFVPPPPSPAPSDDPEAHFEDGLWNYTAAPPTTVRGQSLQCLQVYGSICIYMLAIL